MTEGPPDNICANPVLATCCGGNVPGRLKAEHTSPPKIGNVCRQSVL